MPMVEARPLNGVVFPSSASALSGTNISEAGNLSKIIITIAFSRKNFELLILSRNFLAFSCKKFRLF